MVNRRRIDGSRFETLVTLPNGGPFKQNKITIIAGYSICINQ